MSKYTKSYRARETKKKFPRKGNKILTKDVIKRQTVYVD